MITRWQRRAIHQRQEERERERAAQEYARAAGQLIDALGICPNSPIDEHLFIEGICDNCGCEKKK